MTRRIHRHARPIGVAAVALALCAGAFVGVMSATASASPRPNAKPEVLGHFLCYQARESGIKPAPNILLENALQPSPFAPKFLTNYWHCNPANKSVPSGLYVTSHPLAHLFCIGIEYAFNGATVELSNQFGKAVMTVGLPKDLCLPSWKSNLGPPNMTPNAPSSVLDHYACYAIKELASSYGFKAPAFVKAEDEFSYPKFTQLKLGIADLLCVPTTKINAGVAYPPISASDPSMVCFPTSPTPIWKLVYDQNQFGTAKVVPFTTDEQLCLPSTMSIQSPASG